MIVLDLDWIHLESISLYDLFFIFDWIGKQFYCTYETFIYYRHLKAVLLNSIGLNCPKARVIMTELKLENQNIANHFHLFLIWEFLFL